MTLHEAIHTLLKEEHLEDWVYDVRSRASEENDGYVGNSWDHPRVRRFSEIIGRLEEYLETGF